MKTCFSYIFQLDCPECECGVQLKSLTALRVFVHMDLGDLENGDTTLIKNLSGLIMT